MTFDDAIEFVLAFEGHYSHDSRDRGGETAWGISKRQYPTIDLENLTREGAKAIYKADYWKPIRGDDLPCPVALALLDFSVHSGVNRSVRTLQRIVGARRDGKMGPETLAGVAAYADNEGGLGLAAALIQARSRFLARLFKRGTLDLAFLAGIWLRTVKLMRAIHEVDRLEHAEGGK